MPVAKKVLLGVLKVCKHFGVQANKIWSIMLTQSLLSGLLTLTLTELFHWGSRFIEIIIK